ncbi:hypothetical protein E2562_029391 [Oryza meyeriana var. granulata]|uniref:Uncharacterized protein n=1 Tax=Oryza meyeriana var. granulata TaxID=110450 RepID=A0A6G1BZD4_9ORYZ|nr:hypothetical protein E2562_029391 [Oryza meyeriana var. granulata]
MLLLLLLPLAEAAVQRCRGSRDLRPDSGAATTRSETPGSRRREAEGSPIQASLPYASAEDGANIIKGTDVVEPIDTEEAPQIPILQSDQDFVEVGRLLHELQS